MVREREVFVENIYMHIFLKRPFGIKGFGSSYNRQERPYEKGELLGGKKLIVLSLRGLM